MTNQITVERDGVRVVCGTGRLDGPQRVVATGPDGEEETVGCKLLIGAAVVLAIVGGLLLALGRTGFRGMPGDVSYQSDNVRVYFPIVTCLVLSVLLTLGTPSGTTTGATPP